MDQEKKKEEEERSAEFKAFDQRFGALMHILCDRREAFEKLVVQHGIVQLQEDKVRLVVDDKLLNECIRELPAETVDEVREKFPVEDYDKLKELRKALQAEEEFVSDWDTFLG